ncbi:MAG: hypothetical protein IIB89_04585 [Chloroflexi bacterium]|nr:hypothetical protein [Chloroflexota bacterium]
METFHDIGYLALDLRPQNVFLDPKTSDVTIIDIGNVTVERPATRRAPPLDIHDVYMELLTWYSTPLDPPADIAVYHEPYGMNAVPMFAQTVNAVIAAFDQEHERSFGYNSPDTGYQLVNVRVIARGLPEKPRMPERLVLPEPSKGSDGSSGPTQRDVYFGPNRGWASVPVIDRLSLPTDATEGPLIVEEYDSTTVVPPGWNAATDQWSNIILEKAP